jgi:hypothetical protein
MEEWSNVGKRETKEASMETTDEEGKDRQQTKPIRYDLCLPGPTIVKAAHCHAHLPRISKIMSLRPLSFRRHHCENQSSSEHRHHHQNTSYKPPKQSIMRVSQLDYELQTLEDERLSGYITTVPTRTTWLLEITVL